MESNQLNRLFDKTNEDLMLCEQKIKSWTKFMDEYKALEERLSTLTDKTTHEIMVPIGGTDLAFMSGYLKHTNEILVLLGDNYFVERSAKQAIDIVGRRLAKCETMLEDLDKEKTQLENWLSFSKQISDEKQNKDFVEIVEEFDEQKEQLWREEHRQRVREYKMAERLKRESEATDVSQKLERLELEESLAEQQPELKSILKKTDKRQDIDRRVAFNDSKPMAQSMEEKRPLETQSHEMAFKNQVIEREVGLTSETSVKNVSEVCPTSSPKVVSRFKANRMKK